MKEDDEGKKKSDLLLVWMIFLESFNNVLCLPGSFLL